MTRMPGFQKFPSLLGRFGVLTLSAALAAAPMSPAFAFAPPDDEDAGDGGDEELDPNSPDGLSARAVEAFEAKEYETAVDLFEKAFDADPNPNYLFNIGRVHEEAGNLRGAIERYEQFVKSPGVDLESRKFANERLRVLREIVAGEDEAAAKQGGGGQAEGPSDPTGPTDTGPTPDDNEAKVAKRNRIVGFTLIGVGAGLLAGGGVAGGLALRKNGIFEDERSPEKAKEYQDEGQNLALTADVLYGVGGAVVVAGVVFAVIGSKKRGGKSARTQFNPSFGRDGAGMSLTHRF